MGEFKKIRKGHALGVNRVAKRDSPSCDSPSFYTSPAPGTTVDASQELTISWDTSYASCLSSPSEIDIYLLSPTTSDAHVKVFSPVPFTPGSYHTTLQPKWWNSTNSVQLQLSIVPSGTPLFLSPIVPGGIWTATYNSSSGIPASYTGNSSSDSDIQTVGGISKAGVPKGAIAAAVLLPIIIIAIAVGIYVRISRRKQSEKTKRFSQAVDARMSRISGDWKSISAKGAQAAIRDSTASGMRMSKVFASEMQMKVGDRISVLNPSSLGRPSLDSTARSSPLNPGERVSRVSFAADAVPRPSRDRVSTYSQGRTSRAYHVGYVPPVPIRTLSQYNQENGEVYQIEEGDDLATMSPTQTEGPVALGDEDVARMSSDLTPALSMMRTGLNPAAKSQDDLLLPRPVDMPVPPTPTLTIPTSPLGTSPSAPPLSPLGMMPMQPQPASIMSPDAMLRAYAERRAAGGGALSPTVPSPAFLGVPASPIGMTTTQYTPSGMRNLTGDPNVGISSHLSPTDAYNRASVAASGESMYSETEEH